MCEHTKTKNTRGPSVAQAVCSRITNRPLFHYNNCAAFHRLLPPTTTTTTTILLLLLVQQHPLFRVLASYTALHFAMGTMVDKRCQARDTASLLQPIQSLDSA